MPRKKKTQEELDFEKLQNAFREITRHSYGRDVLWYILEECGIYDNTFTGNSQTFFNEGKRAVGLSVIQMLEQANPRSYAKLLLEYNNEDLEEDK